MMRAAIVLLASAGALVASFAALAQKDGSLLRIAVVLSTSPQAGAVRFAAFRQGLKELGYVQEKNIWVEVHAWGGAARPLAELAAGVVQSGPAVIVAEGNPTIAALKGAGGTVPIVMSVVGDPVGSGFVGSLVRPGTNITGLSNTAEQLSSKRMELLKDIVPGLGRVAVLRNPGNPTHAIFLRETQSAGQSLGVSAVVFDFASERDLEKAFGAMAGQGVQAAVVLPQPLGIVLGAESPSSRSSTACRQCFLRLSRSKQAASFPTARATPTSGGGPRATSTASSKARVPPGCRSSSPRSSTSCST